METVTKKAMTQKQAQKEAVKRWGEKGVASYRSYAISREDRAAILAKPKEQQTKEESQKAWCSWRYTVGVIMMGMFLEVRGQGDSWEDAFAKADAKVAAEKERWAKIMAGRQTA